MTGRKEPLDDTASRGVVRVEDWALATGLPVETVCRMLNDGEVSGVFHESGEPFGLFDDVLPSAAQLREKGLHVLDTYDPADFASYVDGSEDVVDDELEDPGDDQVGGATWFMAF